MTNQNKFNLNKLLFQSNKNNIDLDNKINSDAILNPSNEFFSRTKLIYESDWILCELEKIKEATALNYEELLPEKAKYNFSVELDVPETHLSFLKHNILSKTVPEQLLRGVGEFNFTSLKEINLRLYDWKGVTAIYTPADLSPENPYDYGFGWWTEGGDGSPPVGLPDPSLAIHPYPQPEGCYSKSTYFNKISCPSVAGGLGPYTLNADGTQLFWGGEWISLSSWIQYVFDNITH